MIFLAVKRPPILRNFIVHPMNSPQPATSEVRKRPATITLLAAFAGLAATIWVNFLLGFEKGDGATVVFLLVGVPTYYLASLAYDVRKAVRELRVEQKPIRTRLVVQAIRR